MRQSTDAKLDALALAVASGASVSRAARDLHVNVTTAQHMSQRPEFWPRVAEHRNAIVRQIHGRLADGGLSAAWVMVELLGKDETAETRLKAARAILDNLLAIANQAELVARLDAIEKRLTAPGAGGQP